MLAADGTFLLRDRFWIDVIYRAAGVGGHLLEPAASVVRSPVRNPVSSFALPFVLLIPVVVPTARPDHAGRSR
jgi:hypothetical protein